MRLTSWPPPEQTDLTVQVATDRLPGLYDATVRLGRADLFHDGWQPMLDSAAMHVLLTDLASLGDEPTQLSTLGWTLRATADGIELSKRTCRPNRSTRLTTGSCYPVNAVSPWSMTCRHWLSSTAA
jgi:hypothetical protein